MFLLTIAETWVHPHCDHLLKALRSHKRLHSSCQYFILHTVIIEEESHLTVWPSYDMTGKIRKGNVPVDQSKICQYKYLLPALLLFCLSISYVSWSLHRWHQRSYSTISFLKPIAKRLEGRGKWGNRSI